MYYGIYCLMVDEGSMNDGIRNVLFHYARVMLQTRRKNMPIKLDNCEGVISTEFECACIGCISGMVFRAEVDTETGSTKVGFIVNPREVDSEELQNPVWSDVVSSDAEYESHPARKAQFN